MEDKRIKDMEASIKAIAEYVRQKTDRLEADLAAMPNVAETGYIKEDLDEIKRKLDSFNDDRELLRMEMKKLDNLQESLDERLQKMENQSRNSGANAVEDRIKKNLQASRVEMDDLRRDITPRIQFLEGKLDRLQEDDGGDSKKIINEMEQKLIDRIDNKIAAKTSFVEKELAEAKAVMEKATPRNDSHKFDSYKAEIKTEIQKMNSETLAGFRGKLSEDIAKVGELERRMNALYEDIKSTSLQSNDQLKESHDDLREKVGMIDKRLNDTLVLKNKVNDLEKILQVAQTKMKSLEVVKDRPLKSAETADVRGLQTQIAELMAAVEEESVNRASLERHVIDMKMKVEGFEADIGDAVSKIKSMEESDVRRLKKEVGEGEDELEDEAVNRIADEKRLMDLEAEINELKRHTAGGEAGTLERRLSVLENKLKHGSSSGPGYDPEKLNNKLRDMESSMKMTSIRVITQQLNEFTKALDRRIPNIVSREEYVRQLADVNQRLRNIEAPDMAPLGNRVARLEAKIEEVASMMRSVYNRVPIVVE